MILRQRSASFSLVVRGNAAATAVATFERKAIALLCPRGCTALVSRMTYVFVTGSIHNDVPVNPVCPKDPTGNSSPRLLENGESISHPNPRKLAAVAGCWGVDIFAIGSAGFTCDTVVKNEKVLSGTKPKC